MASEYSGVVFKALFLRGDMFRQRHIKTNIQPRLMKKRRVSRSPDLLTSQKT